MKVLLVNCGTWKMLSKNGNDSRDVNTCEDDVRVFKVSGSAFLRR